MVVSGTVDPITQYTALQLAVGVGLSAAIAAIVAGDQRIGRQVDSRISAAALGVIGVTTGALTRDLLAETIATSTLVAAFVIEASFAAFFVIRIPKRIAHSLPASDRDWFVRKIRSARLMAFPGVYRGSAQAAAGFVLMPVFGGSAIQ